MNSNLNSQKKASNKGKNRLSFTTWNLLANNCISLQVNRLFAIIEGFMLIYYATMFQHIGIPQNEEQQSSYFLQTDLDIFSKIRNSYEANPNILTIISLALLVFLLGLLITILLMLYFNNSSDIQMLKRKILWKQVVTALLVAFQSFLYLPLFEFILRAYFAFSRLENVNYLILYQTLNTISLVTFAILLLYCKKLFKLNIPHFSIPWCTPYTQYENLVLVSKLALITIVTVDNFGKYYFTESLGCFFLFGLTCFFSLKFFTKFEPVYEKIFLFFQFLTTLFFLQSILSQIFISNLRQEMVVELLIIIFLTISWFYIRQYMKEWILTSFLNGTLKSEIDYTYALYILIELTQRCINQNRQDCQGKLFSILEQHQVTCVNVDCICQNYEEYIDLMRESKLQQNSRFRVNYEQYKAVNNAFKPKQQALINNIERIHIDYKNNSVDNNREEGKVIVNNPTQDLTAQKIDFQEKLYRVDQQQVKENFLNNFIYILVQSIHDKFPQSLRIEFLTNYYAMFILKNPQLCEAQMRQLRQSQRKSWINKQLITTNKLFLLTKYEELNKKNENDIYIDGEYLLQMNDLQQQLIQSIDQLANDSIILWKGFCKEEIDVKDQQVQGSKISKDIKKLCMVFEELEQKKAQKNYKMYFWFGLVQLYILNDYEGYNLYISKMKSALMVSKLLQNNFNANQGLDEDAGLILTDASSNSFGDYILMNIPLCKMLGYIENNQSYSLQHINDMMPRQLAEQHDQIMEKYNRTGESEVLNVKIVQFVKKRNKAITPAEVFIKFHYSQKYGYTFLTLAKPIYELVPFYNDYKIKTEELLFVTIDSNYGQIHDVSENFIKIMKQLDLDVNSIYDFGFEEKPKFIDDLLTDFDFKKYKEERLDRIQNKMIYENNHSLNLSLFNEFQQVARDDQSRVQQMTLPVQLAIYDEIYGQGSLEMSIIIMRLQESNNYNFFDNSNASQFQSQCGIEIENLDEDNDTGSSATYSSMSNSSQSQSYLNSFHSFNQQQTPKSLKMVLQLIFVVFLTILTISSVNVGLNVKKQQETANQVKIVRLAYDRINLTAMNRIIMRVLSNISNGYEPNQNSLMDDRFSVYKEMQRSRIEELRITQNQLNDAEFNYSPEFERLINEGLVQLTYLSDENQAELKNHTMAIASNIYTGRLNTINGFSKQEMEGNTYVQRLNPITDSEYQPTENEKAMFFAIMSGNDGLRSYNWILQQQYIKETQQEAESHEKEGEITAIISITTIFIVGLIVAPIISKTEERKYQALEFFTKIPKEQVETLIRNCENCQNLDSDMQKLKKTNSNFQLDLNEQEQNQISFKAEREALQSGLYSPLDTTNFAEETKEMQNFSKKSTIQKHKNSIGQQNELNFASKLTKVLSSEENSNEQEYKNIMNVISQNKQKKKKQKQFKKDQKEMEKAFQNNQQQRQFLEKKSNSSSVNQSISPRSVQSRVGEESKQQEIEKQKLQQQIDEKKDQINRVAFRAKLVSFLIVMLLILAYSSYFLIAYFVSVTNIQLTVESMHSLDIIFFKDACIENVMSFIRENQIQNQSIPLFEDQSKIASDSILSICFTKEDKYMNLRKNIPAYFSEVTELFQVLETDQICDKIYIGEYQHLQEDCKRASNGLLKKGISNALYYMYSYTQKLNLQFHDAGRTQKRNYEFLYEAINNEETIRLIDTKEYLLEPVFNTLKNDCMQSVINFFNRSVDIFLILYGIYISIIVISLLLFLFLGFNTLKYTMWNTNLLLKMIPKELIEKEEADKLKKFFVT